MQAVDGSRHSRLFRPSRLQPRSLTLAVYAVQAVFQPALESSSFIKAFHVFRVVPCVECERVVLFWVVETTSHVKNFYGFRRSRCEVRYQMLAEALEQPNWPWLSHQILATSFHARGKPFDLVQKLKSHGVEFQIVKAEPLQAVVSVCLLRICKDDIRGKPDSCSAQTAFQNVCRHSRSRS